MPQETKRKLTDFDRWQLHRLKAFLEADSSRTVVDWTLIAELQAIKGYLTQVGLGYAIPAFEQFERDRVSGAVLGPIGGPNLPNECLVCFAAVGMGTERLEH